MIPTEYLDELRARLTLSGIVGRSVPLVRAGRELKGCCPFHTEKTASFYVNDDKAFFHCFGCGAHGDVITFVARTTGRDFTDVVEDLAREAGMDPPKRDPETVERWKRVASMAQVVEIAAKWFEDRLWADDDEGRKARDYLTSRGIEEETARRWRLGWAPPGGKALVRRLLEELSLVPEPCVDSGVLFRGDDESLRSFFRRRLIFPICDRRGRPIAFGGRLIDGDGPKYINTGETPLFDKGRLVYGVQHLRQAVIDDKPLVVVEGYMDVIAMHQAGWTGTVAPLGTALTPPQIKLLFDASSDERKAIVPILLFDGDEAGRRAAVRAIERALPLLRPGRSIAFATPPKEEDPDSLLRAGCADDLAALLAAPRPLVDEVWTDALADADTATPEGKAAIVQALRARVAAIGEPTVRLAYAGDLTPRVGELLGVEVTLLETAGSPRRERRPAFAAGLEQSIAAREVWARGETPTPKHPAGRWLLARGVALGERPGETFRAGALEYVAIDKAGGLVSRGRHPVLMIALRRWIPGARSKIGAVWVIYLTDEGSRFTPRDEATGRDLPSARVFGDSLGTAATLSPAEDGGALVVSPSLETAIQARLARPEARVWAVPGLRAVQSLVLPADIARVTLIGVDRASPEWRNRVTSALAVGGREVRVATVDLVTAGRAMREGGHV